MGLPIGRWGPLVSFFYFFPSLPPCLISFPTVPLRRRAGIAQVTLVAVSLLAGGSSSASTAGSQQLVLGPSLSSSLLPPAASSSHPCGGGAGAGWSTACQWGRSSPTRCLAGARSRSVRLLFFLAVGVLIPRGVFPPRSFPGDELRPASLGIFPWWDDSAPNDSQPNTHKSGIIPLHPIPSHPPNQTLPSRCSLRKRCSTLQLEERRI